MTKENEEEIISDSAQEADEVEVSETPVEELEKVPEINWEDKFLRVNAEMQNIQRRTNEERLTLIRYRSQDLAKKILPSLDNLERALSIESLTDDVRKGLEMVQESLLVALKDEGVVEIATDGVFDPNVHMAVQTVESDDEHPAGHINQVLQKGYQLHERVLRPSMVVVAQ